MLTGLQSTLAVSKSLIVLLSYIDPVTSYLVNILTYWLLVNDARRFTLSFRSIIEATPMQIYSSALIFSPARSIIRNHFFGEIPAWVRNRMLPVVEEEWTPCLQTLVGHSNPVLAVAFSPDG